MLLYHKPDFSVETDQVVALKGAVTDSAASVTSGISGQGFLMASDSLIGHPSGPGMQPVFC